MRWIAVYILAAIPVFAADITLHGWVVNDNDAPEEGARISVRPANTPAYAPIVVRSACKYGFVTRVNASEFLPH